MWLCCRFVVLLCCWNAFCCVVVMASCSFGVSLFFLSVVSCFVVACVVLLCWQLVFVFVSCCVVALLCRFVGLLCDVNYDVVGRLVVSLVSLFLLW